jgi:hypothetical protein
MNATATEIRRPITLATARAQYVHRFTLEHVPAWAYKPCEGNGRYYAPQYRTDAEWYERTSFPGENGVPRREDHCESTGATWPLGQWLNKPCPAFGYLATHDDSKLAQMRAEYEWREPAETVLRDHVTDAAAGENVRAEYVQKLRDIGATVSLRIEHRATTMRRGQVRVSRKPWSLRYADGTLCAAFATLDALERNLRGRAGC